MDGRMHGKNARFDHSFKRGSDWLSVSFPGESNEHRRADGSRRYGRLEMEYKVIQLLSLRLRS